MFSKTARLSIRRFHRWSGVVIGIQLLIWVGSGLYFAWMPFDVIKDEDRRLKPPVNEIDLGRTVSPSTLALPTDFKTKAIVLETSPRGVVYRLEALEGKYIFFDAFTGSPLPMIEADRIAELALPQMKNAEVSELSKIVFMGEAKEDYKGRVPVYQISLDDFRQTRLYADPWTGKIIMTRNIFWRIYDFFWMLHIMDYQEREDFNNVWIKALSFFALVFLISGYTLFFFGKMPRRTSTKKKVGV